MKVALAGVSKRFGRQWVLDDVRLELEPGRVVAVLGLNGAGKSTLLHCLAGILALSRGTISFDGQLFARDRVDLRRRFAFLPDFPLCFGSMTVLEHIAMALRIYDADDVAGIEERVLDLLRSFDLTPLGDSAIKGLSRGQIYKTALVALMSVAPELWLLDEPMASGMDALGLREFRRRARAAADAGATILYTTQILSVAEQFSDEVIVLHKGRLHARGPLDEVRGASELEELFAALREEA